MIFTHWMDSHRISKTLERGDYQIHQLKGVKLEERDNKVPIWDLKISWQWRHKCLPFQLYHCMKEHILPPFSVLKTNINNKVLNLGNWDDKLQCKAFWWYRRRSLHFSYQDYQGQDPDEWYGPPLLHPTALLHTSNKIQNLCHLLHCHLFYRATFPSPSTQFSVMK